MKEYILVLDLNGKWRELTDTNIFNFSIKYFIALNGLSVQFVAIPYFKMIESSNLVQPDIDFVRDLDHIHTYK